MTAIQHRLDLRRVTGNIGAVASDIALHADLDDATIAEIRAAVLQHKVVFFRGQAHLDDAGHVAFARRLGQITQGHPTVQPEQEVFDLDFSGGGAANVWHTDVTFVHRPPSFSLLRGETIPEVGGDTLWANTATAYAALPAELRELADKLWALHTNEFDYAEYANYAEQAAQGGSAKRYYGDFTSTIYKTIHPVVTVHPETGERALLLGGFARGFVGLKSNVFESLKSIFQVEITRPEHTVRWAWQPGDLAIWDNRATQHYGVGDFNPAPRKVKRVTIVGEVPVSVNGEASKAKQGDDTAYNTTFAASRN